MCGRAPVIQRLPLYALIMRVFQIVFHLPRISQRMSAAFTGQMSPSRAYLKEAEGRSVMKEIITLITVAALNISQSGVGNFSADPRSGTAPLAITFNYGNLDLHDTYSINFGDNPANTVTMDCTTSSVCTAGFISHTYTSPGVYEARLNKANRDYCTNKVPCDPPGPSSIQVKITVGGTPLSNATIDPISQVGGVHLTGTAFNTSGLFIAVLNSNYTESTDYFTLRSDACGMPTFSDTCTTTVVSNGQWSAGGYQGIRVSPGAHHVYVFDLSTHLLLATGTFTSQ
jgi:PKD repeat protein